MTSPLSINFPTSPKIAGAHFILTPAQNAAGGWLNVWENFPSVWEKQIRRQIDLAYSLGCNMFAIIGDYRWITNGHINQTQYNSYWNIVLAYCQSLGLSVYMRMTGTAEIVIGGTTDAQLYTAYNSLLASVTSYWPIIIGVDLIIEVNSWSGQSLAQIATHCATIYDQVKPTTSLPLTFSTTEVATGTTIYNNATIRAASDYNDYHVYKQAGYADFPGATTFDVARAAWPTYDIIVGEFGDPISAGQSHNITWIDSVMRFAVVSADTKIRGSCLWALSVQDLDPANDFGMTELDYSARTWITQLFLNEIGIYGGATTTPSAPAAPIVPHDGVVLINPWGTCSDGAGIKFYRNGSLVGTLDLGYDNDYPNMLPATQYTYTAKITTASHGDSAASQPLVFSLPSSRSR